MPLFRASDWRTISSTQAASPVARFRFFVSIVLLGLQDVKDRRRWSCESSTSILPLSRLSSASPAFASPSDYSFSHFDVHIPRPIKPPSILATTFTRTTYEVHRGAPESGSWAGGSCSEGDRCGESKPPDHLVFLVHGIGESLVSADGRGMGVVRDHFERFHRAV